jgi:hypothetical protein
VHVCSSSSPRFTAGALDRGLVDATIWVSPLCTSRATKFPEVCTPLFKAAACYPYCMSARMRGSGADGLVLYNAPDWRERVHLMRRDCIVETALMNNATRSGTGRTESGALVRAMPEGTLSGTDPLPGAEAVMGGSYDVLGTGSAVVSSKWDPQTMGCVQSSTATTIVASKDHPAYHLEQPKSRGFRSILMKGQPFAYAGDVTLTAIEAGNGEYFVSVDRLFGNEINEYTMVNIRAKFPANPPADTIKIQGQLFEQVSVHGSGDRVTVASSPLGLADLKGVAGGQAAHTILVFGHVRCPAPCCIHPQQRIFCSQPIVGHVQGICQRMLDGRIRMEPAAERPELLCTHQDMENRPVCLLPLRIRWHRKVCCSMVFACVYACIIQGGTKGPGMFGFITL